MSAELQAAVRKTLHSRAFERFIGLAVENALAEAARIEGAVQLPEGRTIEVDFDDKNGGLYVWGAGYVQKFYAYLRRPHESTHYKLAGWYGEERRIDLEGRRWDRTVGPMVPDDFGNLVEVPSP